MKLVTAVVRTTSLEGIVQVLGEAGIRGLTYCDVRGVGEEVNLTKPYTVHSRIDVFVPDGQADAVAATILERASTGIPGDGILAIMPVDELYSVRTKQRSA